MSDPIFPLGYRVAGVHCGIKPDSTRLDFTLLVSDQPASAAGVFTQNRVSAAPVKVSRSRVPSPTVRGIAVNSGNANACTGDGGLRDAEQTTEWLARQLGVAARNVLVCSTGVIGKRLPMGCIERGVSQAASQLAADGHAWERAARGIMTTDTVPKAVSRALPVRAGTVRIHGIAKGAAMIGPNMATMLAFIVTDAAVEPAVLQRALANAVERSFNSISVEGHTSTNDTVLALANGASGSGRLEGAELAAFERELAAACQALAWAIVSDAEGAKHRVTIDVEGLTSECDARRVAKVIANSPLVKAAICGGDPNWGRIVSAAGYAGVEFDESEVTLWLNETRLYEHGQPVGFDASVVSQHLIDNRDTSIRIRFNRGSAAWRFWTSDLTEEYVRLNADYHT